MFTRSTPAARLVRGALVLVCAAGAAAACSGTSTSAKAASAGAAPSVSSTAAPRGHASLGDITVTGAYIPQPASPDVAAAYFTVSDSGAQGDTLMSATTYPASKAHLMTEADTGGNAGTMQDLSSGLAIPAHGSVTLKPGGMHLMMDSPQAALTAGGNVVIELRFARAGTLTVTVPVTALLPGGSMSTAPMPSMSSMSGM